MFSHWKDHHLKRNSFVTIVEFVAAQSCLFVVLLRFLLIFWSYWIFFVSVTFHEFCCPCFIYTLTLICCFFFVILCIFTFCTFHSVRVLHMYAITFRILLLSRRALCSISFQTHFLVVEECVFSFIA